MSGGKEKFVTDKLLKRGQNKYTLRNSVRLDDDAKNVNMFWDYMGNEKHINITQHTVSIQPNKGQS